MRLKLLSIADSLPRLGPQWRDRTILIAVLMAGSVLTLLAGNSLQQAEELRRKEQKTAAIVAEPVASGTFPFMKEGLVRSGTTAMAISTTAFGAGQTASGYLAAVVDLSTLFRNVTHLADAARFDLCVFESNAPEAAPHIRQ